jgi:hypothetical protein
MSPWPNSVPFGLTGLTDGLNLVGSLSLNVGINAAGEAFKEQVGIWSTGCGKLNGTKIAFAGASGLLGDLGGRVVSGGFAGAATAATHIIQEGSDVLASGIGANISGVLSLVPGTIERVVGY